MKFTIDLPSGYDHIKDGNPLPPGLILAHLELQAVDRKGRPIAPVYASWSRSWVQQFPLLLNGHMTQVNETIIDNTDVSRTFEGTPSSPTNGEAIFRVQAGVAVTGFGMQFGTGTNAESAADRKLQILIAEGVGAGQMNYQAQVLVAVLAITGGYRIRTERQANNNSGGVISVAEIGLSAQHTYDRTGATTAANFLLLRDKLTSAFSVAAGTGVIGRYIFDFLV